MTITGSNTTNFGIQKLGSNDSAGYSTINEVVDGIDTILNASDRLIKAAQTPTVAYVITGDGVDWVAGLVVTASITDLNVTTGKIADLAVTTGKLAASAVTSAKIADDTIINDDINSAAGIVDTKLATISTTSKVSRSAIDTSGSSAGLVLTSTGSSATPTWQAASIGTSNIATSAVTYIKLDNTAKVYSPVTISSSATLAVGTHDTTTAASIPLVQVTAAATISIPTGGVTGSVINIFSTTSSTVTVQPVSSSVTINGSTSATYTISAQYSIVSLICYAANTWIIAGDYI